MNCPDCGHNTLDYDANGDFCRNPNCDYENREGLPASQHPRPEEY